MRNIYWSDFHTNMHGKHLDDLENWYAFAKDMLDFWAPVYYPYFVRENEQGFHFEDSLSKEEMEKDWKKVIEFCKSKDDFILYPSYEWQGDGTDGDHNVFYKKAEGDIEMPLTYKELAGALPERDVMALPHHPGYKSGHRGKNWKTHNEKLSPVVEIYSSHGSSEASDASIPMNVHIHMGPRGEEGTVLYALKKGIKVGIIASGDNHVCPAISGNGFFGVVADKYDRETIFEAIQNRHTYGVSRSKILLDYTLNGAVMGSEIKCQDINKVSVDIEGTNAIERIEILRNGIIEDTYVHNGKWERDELKGQVKFKFELELGWGPDRRVFKDIKEKMWNVKLETKGKLLDVEKLWTSPGSTINKQESDYFEADILTRKSIQGDSKLAQKNYLTPNIQNQSLIFEIEDDVDNSLVFSIDGEKYDIPIRKILEQSILEAKEKDAEKLLKDRFGFEEYYREDPWWHNAYKFMIHKGSPEKAYNVSYDYEFEGLKKTEDNMMVKVTQKRGDTAWSSPVWIKN